MSTQFWSDKNPLPVLPSDVARCRQMECPKQLECLRFMSPVASRAKGYQVYVCPEVPQGECDLFMPLGTNEKGPGC